MNPSPTLDMKTKTFSLGRGRSSIKLPALFFDYLQFMADETGISRSAMVRHIDKSIGDQRNLTSHLRHACLKHAIERSQKTGERFDVQPGREANQAVIDTLAELLGAQRVDVYENAKSIAAAVEMSSWRPIKEAPGGKAVMGWNESYSHPLPIVVQHVGPAFDKKQVIHLLDPDGNPVGRPFDPEIKPIWPNYFRELRGPVTYKAEEKITA